MRITVADCISFVCSRYLISRDDLIGHCMRANFVKPRHLAIALANEATSASMAFIGTRFGRDHSTVIYAVKRAAARYPEELQELKKQIVAFKEAAE